MENQKIERPWYKKKRFIIPIGLVVLGMFGSIFDDDKNNNNNTTENSVSAENKSSLTDTMSDKTKLLNNIKSVSNDDIDFSQYQDGQSYTIFAALYSAYAKTYYEYKDSKDEEIKKLVKEFGDKIIISQKKNFPKGRLGYFKALKDKLWEHDIDVSIGGQGNTVLNFTGGNYASNANIKETQETLGEMLRLLRFKQTSFRWYKGQDDYQYYTIDSKKDNEIVEEN